MELVELLGEAGAFGSILGVGAIVAMLNWYTLTQLENERWNGSAVLPILAAGITLG